MGIWFYLTVENLTPPVDNDKVRLTEQILENYQKTQARLNINAAKYDNITIASLEDLDTVELQDGIYNIDGYFTGILFVNTSVVENAILQLFFTSENA